MDETNNSNLNTSSDARIKESRWKLAFFVKMLYKAVLVCLGYTICYMQWPLSLLLITAASLIWLDHRDQSKSSKIKAKAAAVSYTKQDLLKRMDEIPSWVKFPDKERAEWLNQVVAQLWPTVNSYLIKFARGPIQSKIRKKYDSFLFESLDFGCTPPKIDGIKVYNQIAAKDSIIIDFDVFYDGNCDMNFSVSGAEIGGIRDFQLSVEVRVVLKPLLLKLPLIGGMQIYFLNTPDISFELEGLTSIPGLSSFIRTKIEEKVTKKIVFPNKITKRFSKSVDPSELKALEPAGVLRVHVFEAKDLMAKDVTGRSDPYAILNVGAQEHTTQIINQTLNPKWDYWCEFVVVDPMSQQLDFRLFDHDTVNEDDPLGSGCVDLSSVVRGETDQWIRLDKAKHGSLHLRFTWLSLSPDLGLLDAISEETRLLRVDTISRALLTVYLETATKIPQAKRGVKPHPYVILTVAKVKQKSRVKKHTADPAWEQGFVFLVPKPDEEALHLSIIDKETGDLLTDFSYKIWDLTQRPDLQISKTEFELANEGSKIVLSLQLRILSNERYDPEEEEDDEEESDSDENFSRQNSLSDATSVKSKVSTTNSPKKVVTEEPIKTSNVNPDSAKPLPSLTRSVVQNANPGEHNLGRIELSLNFSEPRQKLLVTVHQLSSLPLKNPLDIPDPYVKIKMTSQGHISSPTHRTKVKIDSCNPVYEETFEYAFSKPEASEQILKATVKTQKFFNNTIMGYVEVNLKYVNLNEPYKAWFDLRPK